MPAQELRVEWVGENTRLVTLAGVRKSAEWPRGLASSGAYREVIGRRVDEVYVHQTAGGFHDGLAAVDRLADFFAAPPTYRTGPDGKIAMDARGKPRKLGGGRGWPGIAYTFVVPSRPVVIGGKFTVYRIWEDTWRTWHTQAGHANDHGVAVAVVGYYKTRHDKDGPGRDAPDDTAMIALGELVSDYLLPRYGLTAKESLKGHFDAGKPACPGDFLEAWVRRKRGEVVGVTPPKARFTGPLDTATQRQQALEALGYAVGTVDGQWGAKSRAALEAFQEDHDLLVDGFFGPRTEAAIRAALPG